MHNTSYLSSRKSVDYRRMVVSYMREQILKIECARNVKNHFNIHCMDKPLPTLLMPAENPFW